MKKVLIYTIYKNIKIALYQAINNFFKLPEKIRFILMGGANTAFGYIFFTVFYLFFKDILPYQLILLFGYIPATVISFLTFKFLVFKSKKNWKKEYLRVVMSAIIIYIINAISLTMITTIFGSSILLNQLVALIIITIASYIMHKYFSFQMHLQKK
jgi:putative flippase GtrA